MGIALFVEHQGSHENLTKTKVYQDIIHFDVAEKITIEGVFEKVKHRYSPFSKDMGITIVSIQRL
jgi:hypothetical protein